MKKVIVLLLVATGVSVTGLAALRHLEGVTVREGATTVVRSLGAEEAKCSDALVAGAVVREKEVAVTGVGIGITEVLLSDSRGAFASFAVKVVPSYWDVLAKIFADDPEISREVIGGKVVLSGATASSDTLQRVAEAKALDPDRIVSQVSFSPEALQAIVTDFLRRSDATNIAVNVVGREVCLSGYVYDLGMGKSLGERVLKFLREFPGVTVNIEGIRIYKQKILIGIEFVEWNDSRARNLGIKLGDSITATANASYGYQWDRTDGSEKETHNSKASAATGASGSDSGSSGTGAGASIQATLNIAKQNGVAKKTYGTQLATQSGETAEFNNGGTLYVKTNPGAIGTGDLKQFDVGYIIQARPVIVDRETVNLEFKLDYSKLVNEAQIISGNPNNYKLNRYTTKSKYIVRPGESIVLSGFKASEGAETKNGWPFLSHLWGFQWLFGNTSRSNDETEMLLVVTINWLVEDTEGAKAKYKAISDREVSVEMP